MKTLAASLAAAVLLLLAGAAGAQQPQPTQPGAATELYNVQFTKAAPGKTQDLLNSFFTPAPDIPAGAAPPIVFRHVEGDDWDFAILFPLGASTILDARPPSEALMQFRRRVRPARLWHSDTFVVGPPLAEVRKVLGADKADALFTITDYRSAPGHRDDLERTIGRIAAAQRPGTMVQFQHVEGSPWEFLAITRYDSWADFGAQQTDAAAGERLRKQGFAAPDAVGFELREHMISHHDTFAVRVSSPPTAR